MCGRYALSLRPSQVRQRLAEQNMPAEEAPEDDNERIRQSYNFAPGYHGLIYRAQTSERGGGDRHDDNNDANDEDDGQPSPKKAKHSHPEGSQTEVDGRATRETKYKLQAAKWGLVPFWTKRPPDYGSQMRTINCRDDSLIENRGMWNTMKQRKRCIVVAEGFYEWLKKNGGKDKLPHFVKRKDGELMCFAGLWDCVKYEGSEENLWTYTIITTDSNKQLHFLHDRMPVLLEPGSEAMKAWLDPERVGWDKELQSMLKPFEGELECFQVDKGVGKVGNNSPSFVVPIDSKENKKNIANFFGNQQKKNEDTQKDSTVKHDADDAANVKKNEDDNRTTSKVEDPETNAPLPKPKDEPDEELEKAIKQETADIPDSMLHQASDQAVEKGIKREISEVDDEALLKAAESPAKKPALSPAKKVIPGAKKTRSATTNGTVAKTPTKEGNTRITNFFGK